LDWSAVAVRALVTSLAGNDLPTDPAGAHEPSSHKHPSVTGILKIKQVWTVRSEVIKKAHNTILIGIEL
jgi:hypothetical protein